MTIKLGSITTVVASTPNAAREILQRHDDACSSRPVPHAVTALKHPDTAVLWLPPNETWRTIRKALSLYLTNQQKLDNLMHIRENVVEDIVEFLRESGWKKVPVDIGTYDEEDIMGFKTAVKMAMEVQGKFNISDIFPLLKPLDLQNVRRQAKVAFDRLDEVTEGFIKQRLKHRKANLPNFGDMLDSLLDHCENNETSFNLKHINTLLGDVLVATTDTVANTTTWIMAELLLNPDMLVRVREEISQISGIRWENRRGQNSQPAVIKETLRLHAGSPFPLVFMPERFLQNKVDYKGQHYEFIPFGSGRRKCPGMPLAHRMLSLIVASLVYHFDWELLYAKEEMDMNDIFGLTLLKATPLVAIPIPLN
ncbi:geraniol 8-hydroxylase-like protein [Tanacetum coccineum]